jgi:dTDP-4-dehydrorhamnose 3,5-epimerase
VGSNFYIKKSEKINGIWLINNDVFKDLRGSIWTSFIKKEIEDLLPENLNFNHDKFSKSKNNVLRGIHGDHKSWKLVTSVFGKIQQVVVDCRKDSETFGKYESFIISEENQISILVSPSLGNAYYVISEEAVYHYKIAYKGNYFDADQQFTYKWNDPKFSIKWPTKYPILSERDKS